MLSLKPLMALLLATLLCACQVGSKDSASDPLTQARQRWVDQGLQHYRYQVRQQCYCGQQALLPAIVLLEDAIVGYHRCVMGLLKRSGVVSVWSKLSDLSIA